MAIGPWGAPHTLDAEVRAEPGEVESVCLALAEQVAAGAGSGSRGLDYVCYTDGPFPGGVVAIRSGRRWRLAQTQPLPRKLVSPIGAGDSTSAGTLHAWCRGDGAAQDELEVLPLRVPVVGPTWSEDRHESAPDRPQIDPNLTPTRPNFSPMSTTSRHQIDRPNASRKSTLHQIV